MNCQQTRVLIDTLPFEEEPAEQLQSIRDHCRECEPCANVFLSARDTEYGLRLLEEPESMKTSTISLAPEGATRKQNQSLAGRLILRSALISGILLMLAYQFYTFMQQPPNGLVKPIGYRISGELTHLLESNSNVWLLVAGLLLLAFALLNPSRQRFQ